MNNKRTTPLADHPILVTGATGDIGGALAENLAAFAVPFRVMCRRPDQLDAFAARGINGVRGDFGDIDSLRAAMDGCSQLFLLPPSGTDQFTRDKDAIDAARACGVEHIVKISTADANPASAIPGARDHALADSHLHASGLRWTRLQPCSFMKNLLTEAPVIRRGWLPQTSGHGATTWIDTPDVAAAAARVLTDPTRQGGAGDAGRSYLLTGTPATSYPQIAELMTQLLRRRVRYLQVPAPVMVGILRLSGMPSWQARGLIHQFVDVVRRGHDNGRLTSTDLADLLGREPTTLAEFINTHRHQLGTSALRRPRQTPDETAHSTRRLAVG